MKLKGNIAIYGAGGIGKELYSVVSKIGKEIVCFIDKNKNGTKIENIDIVSLEESKKYNITTIIIGIFSYPKECSIYDIVSLLEKYNFNNIITFEEMFQKYYEYFSKANYYWLAPPKFFEKDMEKINKCREVFSDKKSKIIFDSQIKHRLGESYKVLTEPEYLTTQYFPDDIYINKNNINFIDLGAFIGDTIINMMEGGVIFNKILAFEPDIDNYKILAKNMKQLKNSISEFYLFPIGISDKIDKLNFNSGLLDSASFSTTGNDSITVLAIDYAVSGFVPDYIKMDIEGFELNALKGLKETIKNHKPNLAISLYHLPDDIYNIPLWINDNFEDYDFYIRLHYSHCFETVLYAIHKSRAEQSRAEQSRAEQSRAEQSRAEQS
ncbi:FkbM family methyltransferase [uncultured Brachyspira sp.]|uniref:FkbM family methyltransferase n=1 Tax=uncultured Brachyspira sp. TaxID=221953 RepID=UPI00262E4D8A|nr:FkbM family methyltransferase [uncultured Brachyspira sp.]